MTSTIAKKLGLVIWIKAYVLNFSMQILSCTQGIGLVIVGWLNVH